MVIKMDLNEKIDRAVIKIAELKAKGLPLEDVLKKLVEDKDLYGLLVLGIILGYAGSHTQLVYAIVQLLLCISETRYLARFRQPCFWRSAFTMYL